MEVVSVLRLLWRQRLLVALGLLAALMVGIVMAYRVTPAFPPRIESRQYHVGIASASLLVDSPSSQVADLSGGQVGIDVSGLSSRARLLANLMATSPLKDQIARRAGISPASLVASVPVTGSAAEPVPLSAQEENKRPNQLKITFNEELPIITADAQAATPELAARIASAAPEELVVFLRSVAASDRVPDVRQLVVSRLGEARSALVSRGPRRLFALIGLVSVFGLWCAGIVVVSRLACVWRQAASDDRQGFAAAPVARREHTPVDAPTIENAGDDEPPRPPRQTPGAMPAVGSGAAKRSELTEVPELPEFPERVRRRRNFAA